MEFELVRRMGVTVANTDAVLPRPVMYDHQNDVAYISAGLSAECRARVADALLAAVVDRGLRSPRY